MITLRPGDIMAGGAVIRQLEDIEEARELHKLAFPADDWVGDDHTFWVGLNNTGPVGFASAVAWEKEGAGNVFLSRAAVVQAHSKLGLHKALIAARVLWAWEHGANRCVTYTTLKNYQSMVNLLHSGFRFYKPPRGKHWAGRWVHYYERVRTHG